MSEILSENRSDTPSETTEISMPLNLINQSDGSDNKIQSSEEVIQQQPSKVNNDVNIINESVNENTTDEILAENLVNMNVSSENTTPNESSATPPNNEEEKLEDIQLNSDDNEDESPENDVQLVVDEAAMAAQEEEIKELINQQTQTQFKQYVEEEHPGNLVKQQELLKELQEQQFQQYVQQVYQQLLLHQSQQGEQLRAIADKKAFLEAREMDKKFKKPQKNVTEKLLNIESTEDDIKDNKNNEVLSNTIQNPATPVKLVLNPSEYSTKIVNTEESVKPSELPNGHQINSSQAKSDENTSSPTTYVLNQPDLNSPIVINRNEDSDVEEEWTTVEELLESNINLNPVPPPLLPASLWTRQDINEFKVFVKDNKEGIAGCMKVSSLSSATIKVPTHPKARYVCWEFATDYYDLGFGVYFEWLISPGEEVSVHMSDSEDDDYDEDELENGEGDEQNAGKDSRGENGDPERGSRKSVENEPPIDEIIPIYRRDCHKEVYCGSHMFPGNGIYHLKLDNSFSLLRGKWVYYRVYYSK